MCRTCRPILAMVNSILTKRLKITVKEKMQTQNAMLFIQSQLTWQKNKSLVSVTTGKDIEVEDLVAEVHVRNAGF